MERPGIMIILKRILCLLLISAAACCGGQERKPLYSNGDLISITGNVSMAGNEPFTRMVIRPSDGKGAFFLPVNYKKEKNNLIGMTVTVTGQVEVRQLKSADHKYTVYEYHIIPDKIEDVKAPPLK